MTARSDEWTRDYATRALDEVTRLWRIDASEPQFIRFGTNAVFRLGDVVVRITRPKTPSEEIERELALARFLEAAGFPAMRAADLEQPVRVGNSYASAWLWIPHDPDQRVGDYDFGRLLAEFHEVTDEFELALPSWDQLDRVSARITAIGQKALFGPAEVEALTRWRDAVAEELDTVDSDLGWGPIHGDAHTANALMARHGPVLIDFDHLCRGPREWDLIPAALAARRFGRDPATYREFLRGYGVEHVVGWQTYVRLRELSAATWLFSLETGTSRSVESDRRMRLFMGDPTPPHWSAH